LSCPTFGTRGNGGQESATCSHPLTRRNLTIARHLRHPRPSPGNYGYRGYRQAPAATAAIAWQPRPPRPSPGNRGHCGHLQAPAAPAAIAWHPWHLRLPRPSPGTRGHRGHRLAPTAPAAIAWQPWQRHGTYPPARHLSTSTTQRDPGASRPPGIRRLGRPGPAPINNATRPRCQSSVLACRTPAGRKFPGVL
jgi:hypothetical protein